MPHLFEILSTSKWAIAITAITVVINLVLKYLIARPKNKSKNDITITFKSEDGEEIKITKTDATAKEIKEIMQKALDSSPVNKNTGH